MKTPRDATAEHTLSAATGRPVDIVCLGEMLIDFVPEPGSYQADDRDAADAEAVVPRGGERFVKAAGGAPANVAVAASQLGASTAMIAAVGDDPFGRFLVAELRRNGVDVSAVAAVKEQTAVAFVALGEGGERDFMFYFADAAHDRVTPEQVERAFARPTFTGAKTLHLGSNSLAAQPVAAASERAVELAIQTGITVSFDVNLRLPFWDDVATARAAIERLLPNAGLVKLSLDELEFVTGDATLAGAERFASALTAARARLVCVTLGAGGAWYFTSATAGAVDAPTVRSLDTTGAGDAFVAAVLAADVLDPSRWSSPSGTREAVGRASAYASLSTTVRGAIPSYGDATALARFISEAGVSW